MKPTHQVGILLLLLLSAAAPATQPAPTTRPTAAELAIAKPLLAEADKQALALGDGLSTAPGAQAWLQAHVRAGDWASARSIIDAGSPASRTRVYELACLQAATAGDMELARQIVDQQLPDAAAKERGRATIATAMAWQGDPAAATAALKTASDSTERFYLLSALAYAQIRSGDRAAAKASCQEMAKDAQAQPTALRRVEVTVAVRMMAQAGDVDAARTLVPETSDTISAIAEGQALAGDIDGFKTTIASLNGRWVAESRANACQYAARGLARQGDIAGAQRVLALCDAGPQADDIRDQIAAAQVRAGDVSAALATTAQITASPTAQLQAYAIIARAQFLAGDPTAAARTLSLARKAADHVLPSRFVNPGIQLAYVQAASGDTAGAIKAIQDATTDPAELLLAYSTAARMELSPP